MEINKVYPSIYGFLIIGKYPHNVKFPEEIITNKNRQPYLVYELKDNELILRSAGGTEKNAMKYCNDDSRYLVYPNEYWR
jgi:hypothetical protein